MAMSDDPRYRRGQSSNQRPPQGQDEMRGRGESRSERPARSYSQVDTPGERQGAAGGRTPSFSAYRPEAYASAEKRAPRQEWDDSRTSPQRPQSPTAEAYPRPAPERPGAQSAQHDSRDSYRDRGQADPYAVPSQREYEQEWRPSSYQDSKPSYQDNKPSYQESTPSYQESKFASFYDETPPEPDVQAVHDRFFAQADTEVPKARYRGSDYSDAAYEAPHDEPAYAPPPPSQRAAFSADREFSSWDSFEQAPAPASVRPYSAPPAPAHAHDDDMDADFFADEDEFENEDFHEEKKSGRTRLVAAVLVGAILTGGGLAYLYKTSANRGVGDGELPVVAAGVEPVKVSSNDPVSRKFPPSKPIQARLGEGGEADTDTTSVASSAPSGQETAGAVTTTGGGSLEDRINKALHDAKGGDTRDGGGSAGADSSGYNSPDAPTGVRTVQVNPDGSIGGGDGQSFGNSGRRTRPAAAPEQVAMNTAQDVEPAAPPPANTRSLGRVAAAPPATPQAEIPEAPAGTGQFFVQIGARNDQAQALAAFNGMQQKYASVLGNYSPSVRKADLGDKGIWYRLRVGPFTDKPGADKLCDDLKTAGWKQCFTVKD